MIQTVINLYLWIYIYIWNIVLHKVILDPFIGVLEDFKKFEEMIERSIDI